MTPSLFDILSLNNTDIRGNIAAKLKASNSPDKKIKIIISMDL